jgi:hypothetical protein
MKYVVLKLELIKQRENTHIKASAVSPATPLSQQQIIVCFFIKIELGNFI